MAGFPLTSQLIGSDIGWNGPDATASQQAFYTLANQILTLQNQLTAANTKIATLTTSLATRGNYIESVVGNGTVGSWTTNVAKNITSLLIPAGTWQVFADAEFEGAPVTGTSSLFQITTISAAFQTTGGLNQSAFETNAVPLATANVRAGLSPQKIVSTAAAPVTVFLVGRIVFSGGTPTAGGALRAWQVGP